MAATQSWVELHRLYKEAYTLFAASVPQSQQAHRAENIPPILRFSYMSWAVAVMFSSLIFHGLLHTEINFCISMQKKINVAVPVTLSFNVFLSTLQTSLCFLPGCFLHVECSPL